jgi:glutamine amidotransferase-like uncharacterized protein
MIKGLVSIIASSYNSTEYIAFLDSDNVWLSNKLENQIRQFDDKNIGIVYSNYEKMSESGIRKNRFIKSSPMVTYLELLKGNCIQWVTAIYDASIVVKVFFRKQFRH